MKLINVSSIMSRKRFLAVFFPLLCAFLLSSCAGIPVETIESLPEGKARVLLYVHVKDGKVPPLAVLTLKEAVLEGTSKVPVFSGAQKLDSKEVFDNQLFVSEAFVDPGVYKGLTFVLDSTKDAKQPSYKMPMSLNVAAGKSVVVNAEWDPSAARGVEGEYGYVFTARPQTLIPAGQMAIVSNYGDGYVTIIDKDAERVVAAVSVGSGPTSVAVGDHKERFYVLNSLDRTISVVRVPSLDIEETISIFAGIEPVEMAIGKAGDYSSDDKLYVLNRLSDDITVINARTIQQVKTISVGRAPSHIVSYPDRKELYVSNELSNDVTVVNSTGDSVSATIPVGMNPLGLVVSGEDMYVFSGMERSVVRYSLATRKESGRWQLRTAVARGIEAFSGRIFPVSPETGEVASMQDGMWVWSGVRSGDGAFSVAADEFRNRLFVVNRGGNSVSILDPFAAGVLKVLRVGNNPHSVYIAR